MCIYRKLNYNFEVTFFTFVYHDFFRNITELPIFKYKFI